MYNSSVSMLLVGTTDFAIISHKVSRYIFCICFFPKSGPLITISVSTKDHLVLKELLMHVQDGGVPSLTPINLGSLHVGGHSLAFILYLLSISNILIACILHLDFVEEVKHIKLSPDEFLSSYDVSVLFTSALNIIKGLLEKDNTLKNRTVLAVDDILLLLEFCLKNTYFCFQDQFYE